MIGKKVEYKKEDSRWSTYEGTVLDKVSSNGTDFYLIQNIITNEVDKVRFNQIIKVL